MDEIRPDAEETCQLLERVRGGDQQALEALLARHRDLLRDYVAHRLAGGGAGRFDPSDVVQEAQLEIARRLGDFLERRPMPFHLWIRKTAYENLVELWRRHVQADCRTIAHEVPLPADSSLLLARQLLAGSAEPGQQLIEQEMIERVRQGLAQLQENDREILLLRAFEGLTNHESAQILGLGPDAASKRYGRALRRLRTVLRSQG
ncbi:MAG: sigma-70 family RNA polymerase sigma factor [Gemmataceae bacterium]|nr:sigma-70 family RNA polymerase sigma factor [Gemmataceae bacterium]